MPLVLLWPFLFHYTLLSRLELHPDPFLAQALCMHSKNLNLQSSTLSSIPQHIIHLLHPYFTKPLFREISALFWSPPVKYLDKLITKTDIESTLWTFFQLSFLTFFFITAMIGFSGIKVILKIKLCMFEIYIVQMYRRVKEPNEKVLGNRK